MASTLYILSPSKNVARASGDLAGLARPYALISDNGEVQQQGHDVLGNLQGIAATARQVTLLLAASDVTLLTVKIPPMSAAKLKTALPNLIEDQLLTDTSELILLASTPVDGTCSIAAVDRSWMEALHAEAQVLRPKKLTAYALSMAMQTQADAMSVLIEPQQQVVELAFHQPGQSAAGLTFDLGSERSSNSSSGPVSALVQEILQTLNLFSAGVAVKVSVPAEHIEMYQQLAEEDSELAGRFHFQPSGWVARIAGLNSSTINLMSSVSHENQTSFDWHRWRWPLGLALATLTINLAGLNLQWLSMKREAQALNDSLTQTYRTSFPKESVIRDPLLQMQQKINLSRKLVGESTPDDFLVLSAQFAQVWDAMVADKPSAPAIVTMEYREHSLFVKIKSAGLLQVDQFKTGLQAHSLVLVSTSDGVLQIRPDRGDGK
ncbi:type II secretion system protein GspL [Undibacterium sp. Ren11W]|uniref:type II secretion system protein GspL n=1 Tax=Undibacterium sp. Ren11W TaxID=3413045 RepID=UPI003BEF7051